MRRGGAHIFQIIRADRISLYDVPGKPGTHNLACGTIFVPGKPGTHNTTWLVLFVGAAFMRHMRRREHAQLW